VDQPNPRASFVADETHLGTSEQAWSASPHLAELPPLEVPVASEVVVVAPHPDDEVLGAGGLLQVLAAAGARIEVCAVTDGEGSHPGAPIQALRRIRTEESTTALSRLGLGNVARHRLGYPDGGVGGYEGQLVAYLRHRLVPGTLCVAPWRRDGHPDHDASGRAAADAVGRTGAQLLEYVVWGWHWADPLAADLPWAACRRLGLDRRRTARKRWATTAFRSQIQPYLGAPDDRVVLPPLILRRFWRPFEVYIA
jgi:LmbE family N-acetylglucosaminyl deacetylase